MNSDGANVLDQVAAFIGRYVAFPSEHCLPVVALWAAHTHAVRCFYVTPRLVLDSAEPGSGKTRVLEALNLVCADPEMTISVTPAAVFRLLDEKPYTLLFDEVDAIFNPKNGGNYEDLRALLNAGYKRGATIARCVGDAKAMKVQRFTVFAPVALAGIAGHMPATITTRAVTIHMRKRAPGERVEQFRERQAAKLAAPVRDALAEWVVSAMGDLLDAEPDMPEGVVDRPAEVWEALLAIADAAGGDWPKRAREACEHFVLKSNGNGQSFGVKLLADMHRIFGDAKAMPTAEVIEKLIALPESMWADLGGKPLDARRLAKALKAYEVEPVPYRDGDGTVRGYTVHAAQSSVGLGDAWQRYLSPADIERNERNERNKAGQTRNGSEPADVTSVTKQDQVTSVTDAVTVPAPPLTSTVTDVTAVTPKTRCRVCRFAIDPAAGDVHPGCEAA